MFDSNNFLSNPAVDPGKVIFFVFSIFRAQWCTFLAISLLQALSLFGAILICLIAIGSFLHFVVIRSGDFDGEAAIVIPLLLLIFVSSIAIGWVWCIYAGAMMRAAAEICASGTPSTCLTVAIASKNGCKTVGFQLLFGLMICTGVLVLGKVLANLLGNDGDDDVFDDDFYPDNTSVWSSPHRSSPGIIYLICLLYAILVYIINISMIATIPTIVVENKSSCSALRRSWNLCKNSLCLISLSVASLILLNSFIFFILWASIPAKAVYIHLHIYVYIVRLYPILSVEVLFFYFSVYPASMITAVVLYVSLRVRFEGLTQSELSEELLLTHPEPIAPPATEDGLASIAPNDEDETPLLHAELVTEVV